MNNRFGGVRLFPATAIIWTIILAIFTGACTPAPTEDPLALTDAGIGPINEDTPFNGEVITDLFPNLLVEPGQSMSEGESYPVIRIIEGDQELFTIIPGSERITILRIEILSPFTTLNNGGAIGDLFASLMPGEIVPDISPPVCDRGLEELSAFTICAAPSYERIYFVFEGAWDGPDSQLPPRRILDNWNLARIIWAP